MMGGRLGMDHHDDDDFPACAANCYAATMSCVHCIDDDVLVDLGRD